MMLARTHRITLLCAFVFLVATSPGFAQTIYLDTNGDGLSSAEDVLSPTGITTADVWLITNQNPDGSVAFCSSGCQDLSIVSYEFVLRATGGTVTWGTYSGNTAFGSAEPTQSTTEFRARSLGSSLHPGGRYRLGTLQVSVTSGNPTLSFVAPISGVFVTGFGGNCYGTDYDNLYKLGTDWGSTPQYARATGLAFTDQNASGGCTPESGEYGVEGLTVNLSPGDLTATTDATGRYSFCGLAPGTYTVSLIPGPPQTCPPATGSHTFTIAAGQIVDGLNFGVNVAPASVSGVVFSDVNGTSNSQCDPEAGEPGISGITVTLNPGGRTCVTNLAGEYEFTNVAPGPTTIFVSPGPDWLASCPPTGKVELPNPSNQNFALIPTPASPDLRASIAGTRARRGRQKSIYVRCDNRGQTVSNVTALVTLPPAATYVSSGSPPGTYDSQSHSVLFQLGTLVPGAIVYPSVAIDVPLIPIGTPLVSSVYVEPTAGDLNPANNKGTDREFVRGPFDPNEKEVQPSGRILRSDTLTYQIDFQNVGNDTAFTVVVRDTLDVNLDPSTVISGASSDPYVFTRSGRAITWTFNGIDLPDSGANEPESHGLVSFRVLPLSTAPDGQQIHNQASIYFDFNAAVVTNATTNVIDSPPAIVPVADRAVAPGGSYDSPIQGSDAEGDSVNFAMESGPSFATVTNTGALTGNLHLTPQPGDVGNATVVIRASDGLLTSRDTCTVAVLSPTGVGEVETFAPQEIRLGSSLPTTCFNFRPASGAFSANDVDPQSVVMTGMRGKDQSIHAASTTSQGSAGAGPVCFRLADLRSLFRDVKGTQELTVWCEGSLHSGTKFAGALSVTVRTGAGRFAASVSPNPLNPAGLLTFRVIKPGPVRVHLFDLHGRKVRTLYDQLAVAAGYIEVRLDGVNDSGRPLASGIYYYQIETAEGSQSGRVTVLR